MLEIIIAVYAGIVWLIFFKLKLLPWNSTSKVIVFTIPIIGTIALVLTLNVIAPTSNDVRVTRYVVPIVPQVKGRVVEVAVAPNDRVKRGDVLFKIDPTPYQAQVDAVAAKHKLAKKRVGEFEALVKTGSGNRFDLEKARADLEELTAQLGNAQWELDQTVMKAPNDGTVVNVQLRVGAFVAALPISPAMSFLEDEAQVYMLFRQNELYKVAPGNSAEFYIPTNPGHIYKAKVDSVVWAQSQGQLNAGGNLPTTGIAPAIPNRFPVKLTLEDKDAVDLIPAGAIGDGTIYTDHASVLHIIRKIMVRVSSKLDYLVLKLH